MKKITLLVVAALATVSAFAFNLPADNVRLYSMEQTYAPSAADEGTGYAYTYVSLASDFEDAEKTLDGTYDALALKVKGEVFQFRFQSESFIEGTAQGDHTTVTWLNGEHETELVVTPLEGTVENTYSDATFIYVKLPSDYAARFNNNDACFHVHFGGQGSTGNLEISEAYIFKSSGTGIADVIADSIESGKAVKAIENGQVVIVKDGAVYSILGEKIK